jgi:hypothetical protein
MKAFNKLALFVSVFAFFNVVQGETLLFSFGVYSDLKAIGGGQQRNVVEALNNMGVDFSVLPGDLVPDADFTAEIFDSLTIIGTQYGPMWPVVGNHDLRRLPDTWDYSLSYEKYREAFSYVTGQPGYASGEITYYSFHHKGSHFVCLNNMNSCNFNTGDPQKLWLDSLVTTDLVKNAEHVFVFAHYAVQSVTGLGSRWEDCITPYFESLPNLAGVFCGDRHNLVYRQHNGMGVYTVPAIGALRTDFTGTVPAGVTYDDTFRGYLCVDVYCDAVVSSVYDNFNALKYRDTIRSGFDYCTPTKNSSPFLLSRDNIAVHPNPFTPSVRIHYQGRNDADIRIYSVSGMLVKSIKRLRAGHQVVWAPENLPGGIYLIKVRDGSRELTRKVTYLK